MRVRHVLDQGEQRASLLSRRKLSCSLLMCLVSSNFWVCLFDVCIRDPGCCCCSCCRDQSYAMSHTETLTAAGAAVPAPTCRLWVCSFASVLPSASLAVRPWRGCLYYRGAACRATNRLRYGHSTERAANHAYHACCGGSIDTRVPARAGGCARDASECAKQRSHVTRRRST
jgi:hypothetical protein